MNPENEASRPADTEAAPNDQLLAKSKGICRNCSKPILWGATDDGKFIALDPAVWTFSIVGERDGHLLVERSSSAFGTHWSVCSKRPWRAPGATAPVREPGRGEQR